MSYKNGVNTDAQEQLTIFIETLTGTTFEVKVSPQDRVKTIKSKIQKVEGIPVSHQHLLYNSKELQDSSCVTEPSVALHDQATVKLVLSLRGGPISLVHQAVPFNRNILKNLLKFNREELEEDLPPGCKMAILVLRVGDQLNLLHIVDDVDDSHDSLSNSRENLSIDSLEDEISKSVEENSITMGKVCDLKEKMEKLSLQRKGPKVDIKNEDVGATSLSRDVLHPSKLVGPIKLPSIDHQIRGEMFKSRSEFSKIPVLPDIIPRPFQSTSRDLECVTLGKESTSTEICDTIRPKTCPGSLAESQFYNVYSDDECENSLQIAQPHFRSCVSACASKLHHEWGGGKTLLPSLNILPPISGVSDILNNHRQVSNTDPRDMPSTQVPSIEKLSVVHRNLSSTLKLKQNLRKDTQSFLNRTESNFFPKNVNCQEKSLQEGFSNSHYLPSTSHEFFPTPSSDFSSLITKMDSSSCDLATSKINNHVEEPLLSNKKIFDKKSRLRCAECKKRLSLTNTFECRCGFAFCSYHRYSETHHCTYDFKKESRKMLEQAIPSVVAPKLPKI
ncbi:uncharacterized protein LOC124362585 [Homalodisca vitripennis]|nr:uncharacterized protein LOC124362585 [Homalodisca vitripennis]XP_046673179.1 uncharacterized protein LOC124362585 [Homalodisca vitripennis]